MIGMYVRNLVASPAESVVRPAARKYDFQQNAVYVMHAVVHCISISVPEASGGSHSRSVDGNLDRLMSHPHDARLT